MAGDLVDVTDATFAAQVLASPVPVLVDFWGHHCPPCDAILPVLTDLARDHAGRLRVAKLETAANDVATGEYDVLALPTLVLFAKGQPVARFVGVVTRAKLERALEQLGAR